VVQTTDCIRITNLYVWFSGRNWVCPNLRFHNVVCNFKNNMAVRKDADSTVN